MLAGEDELDDELIQDSAIRAALGSADAAVRPVGQQQPIHPGLGQHWTRSCQQSPPPLVPDQMQYFTNLFAKFEEKTDASRKEMLTLASVQFQHAKLQADIVETKQRLHQQGAATQAQITKHAEAIDAHSKDITYLQQTLRELQKALAASPDERPTAVPYSELTHAILGSLGWDDDRTTIETQAREALVAAQVDMSKLLSSKVQCNTGLAAEVVFQDPETLDVTGNRLKELHLQFQGP